MNRIDRIREIQRTVIKTYKIVDAYLVNFFSQLYLIRIFKTSS